MKKDNLLIPKITLTIFEKNNVKYWICPSIRKMRKMISSSLKSDFKNDVKARLRVKYGRAMTAQGKIEVFDNQAEVNSLADLGKVFNAFIDKDLWLPK